METCIFQPRPLPRLTSLAAAPPPALGAPRRRSRRVARVLRLVVALSLLDLAVTFGYMSTTGMYEGNPLVVSLIRHSGSFAPVAVFKLLSLLLGIGILHRLRTHPLAEVGAWIALVALTMVTVQWIRYAAFIMGPNGDHLMRLVLRDSGWVGFS